MVCAPTSLLLRAVYIHHSGTYLLSVWWMCTQVDFLFNPTHTAAMNSSIDCIIFLWGVSFKDLLGYKFAWSEIDHVIPGSSLQWLHQSLSLQNYMRFPISSCPSNTQLCPALHVFLNLVRVKWYPVILVCTSFDFEYFLNWLFISLPFSIGVNICFVVMP